MKKNKPVIPTSRAGTKLKRIAIFFREDNTAAKRWAKRITREITQLRPEIIMTGKKPDLVIALGGDGTILEASRRYQSSSPIIAGFNLGHVGFLASARRPKDFSRSLLWLLSGDFTITERMQIEGKVYRKNTLVYSTNALNEIAIQGILSGIKATVLLDNHPLQYVHGTGVLVSTPTGSTAYNLSAHGPIVTPDIRSIIITEILDHNIPTPSIIIKYTKTVEIRVTEVRKLGLFKITKTDEQVDAVLAADDMGPFPILEDDSIIIAASKDVVRFAEFEEGYFVKSLQEKFAFQ